MNYMIIVTFVAGVVNELIQVAWVHHAEKGNAFRAAGVTAIMCTTGLFGLYSIVSAVQDKTGGLPIAMAWVIGSCIGTYFGVRFAKSDKEKEK